MVYSKRRGELVAIDGTCGRRVQAAAEQLVWKTPNHRYAGLSRWDASKTFSTLKLDRAPGPRSLLLLYAADLSWRLRMEIQPALERGQRIIAAPYLTTAMAYGQSAGLSVSWMEELFRFAPRPDTAHELPYRPCASCDALDGFIEFCTALQAAGQSSPRPDCEIRA